MSELGKNVQDRLVAELLLLDRADELNIAISQQQIDERMDYVAETNPRLFQSVPEHELQEQIARELKKQQVMFRDVDSKVHITNTDLTLICQEQSEKSRELGIAQILFRRDRAEAERKANEVLQKFQEGVSFGQLAETYSDDSNAQKNQGELGFFRKGQLLATIEQEGLSAAKRDKLVN